MTFAVIYVHTEHKTRRVIGCGETKAALPARWRSGGETHAERGREKRSGREKSTYL